MRGARRVEASGSTGVALDGLEARTTVIGRAREGGGVGRVAGVVVVWEAVMKLVVDEGV